MLPGCITIAENRHFQEEYKNHRPQAKNAFFKEEKKSFF